MGVDFIVAGAGLKGEFEKEARETKNKAVVNA